MSEGAIFLRGDLVVAANLAADYGLRHTGDDGTHIFVEADFLHSMAGVVEAAQGYVCDETGRITNYERISRQMEGSVDLTEFDIVLSGALHKEIKRNAASILRNEPIAELRHLQQNGLQYWLKQRDLKRQLTEIAFGDTEFVSIELLPD